jgi:hypothetical protein
MCACPASEKQPLSTLSMLVGTFAAIAPLPAPALHAVQHPLRLSCSVLGKRLRLQTLPSNGCTCGSGRLGTDAAHVRCFLPPQVFAIILATLHPLECCRFFPHRSIKSRAENAPRRGNVTSALMTGVLQGSADKTCMPAAICQRSMLTPHAHCATPTVFKKPKPQGGARGY